MAFLERLSKPAFLFLVAILLSVSPARADLWNLWGLFGSDRAPVEATREPQRSAAAETPVPEGLNPVPETRSQISLSFAPLVKQTAPAVVNVYAARAVPQRLSPFAGDPFFGQFFNRREPSVPRMESALGSGVIVDPDGLVVTNNHVIQGADEVRIAFDDGREFETSVVLKDEQIDLAVLSIEDGNADFAALDLADSDGLEIGDLVLAIGNPFGIGQTVTNGIVSALARRHLSPGDPGVFIQTDAAINPGNSGGALIDMSGRLVGVNTAIFSRSGGSNGIGFAIPSNLVASFVRAAKAGGEFNRPYVGAVFGSVTPDIADAVGLSRPSGVIVQSVREGTPANEAGLEAGDVILEVGSVAVADPDALGYRLATIGIGSSTTLTVLRGDDRESLTIALAGAPETPPRDQRTVSGRNPFSGATVWNLSPKVAEELDLPLEETGVVLANVERGSLAARFGLRPRDILVSVDGRPVSSTEDLVSLLSANGAGFAFEIERGGRRFVRRVR